MRKYLFAISLLFSIATHLYSGEVAQYKIIGISADSHYLAFAEYGINQENKMFANVSIVSVPQNAFIANGIRQNVYDVVPQIDQDGVNALLQTVSTNEALLKQYNINLLDSGRLIYILLDGDIAANSILFTDYDSKIDYSATLSQHIKSTDVPVKTSGAFHLSVGITHNDETTSMSVGSPEHYRAGVKNYIIRAVYTTQDNTSLIFVVEKHMNSKSPRETPNIYYMVETVRWRK